MATAMCSTRLALPTQRRTAALARPFSAARLPSRRPLAVRAAADRSDNKQQQEVAATVLLAAAGLLAPLVLDTGAAEAVPALLKGRTFALIHPVSGVGSTALPGIPS